MNIEEVVAKYIELRDRKAALAEKHAEEMKPFDEGMAAIEKWLMGEMDRMGVESLKTPAGTPYKATSRTVKLQDAQKFKEFVFGPAIEALVTSYGEDERKIITALLMDGCKWDIVDFRVGKKGAVEHFETHNQVPPGVEFDQFTKINIRRS